MKKLELKPTKPQQRNKTMDDYELELFESITLEEIDAIIDDYYDF